MGVARAVALDMHRLIVSGMHEAALAALASFAAARGFLPDRRIALQYTTSPKPHELHGLETPVLD